MAKVDAIGAFAASRSTERSRASIVLEAEAAMRQWPNDRQVFESVIRALVVIDPMRAIAHAERWRARDPYDAELATLLAQTRQLAELKAKMRADREASELRSAEERARSERLREVLVATVAEAKRAIRVERNDGWCVIEERGALPSRYLRVTNTDENALTWLWSSYGARDPAEKVDGRGGGDLANLVALVRSWFVDDARWQDVPALAR